MRKIHRINQLEKASFLLLAWSLASIVICFMSMAYRGYSTSQDSVVIILALIGMILSTCYERERDKLSASLDSLPNPLEKAISSHHGNTLNEVMEALRDERLEYVSVFDRYGQSIAEGTLLSPEECNLASDGYKALRNAGGSCFFLHNHPGLFEGPFSEEDWKWFVGHPVCSTMIVVTTHFTYVVENPGISIDKEEFSRYIDCVFEQFPKKFRSHKQAIRYLVGITKQIADHYGFRFEMEDLRESRVVVRRIAMRILNTMF